MDGGYYIGHTQDLTERLERHNQGRVKYCKRNPPNPPFLKRLDISSPNVGTEGDFAARSFSRKPPQHTQCTSKAKLYHPHSRWVF